MAKPKAYLLVGLPRAGVPVLTAALHQHREALDDAGVRVPSRSADEMFRAAVELRREHRAWGLRRKDVEGAWAGVARRATKKADRTVLVGHELLAGADPDQIALLVDGLAGCAVHVVVCATVPDPLAGLVPGELDLADVLGRWQHAVGSPDRVHVLVVDRHDPAAAWRALGRLAGFDAAALPLPHPAAVVAGFDATTLRLLSESTGCLLDHDELVELAEHWQKVVADGGYDVRGDLPGVVPVRAAHPTDPSRAAEQLRVDTLRDALADAVTEVARLRGRLAEPPEQSGVSAAARRPRRRFAR